MNNEFIREINKINKNILKFNVTLKSYNTMKLDGLVKYLLKPSTFIELKKVLKVINKYKIKYYVIGNGSNILFTSKEKECLIKLDFKKSKYKNILHSNELLMKLAQEFLDNSYSGFETLAMIPASVGGAIVMNAGAYACNISDLIELVYYLDEELKFKVITKEECKFNYRNSIFKNSKKIVLGCKVKLIEGNKMEIKEKMIECNEKRKRSQPIEYPSSGSIFKNTINYPSWKLIEEVNLKGYLVNGAMISDKHANFIINYDNAKCEDIIALINLVVKEVKNKFNIEIEKEIIIID